MCSKIISLKFFAWCSMASTLLICYLRLYICISTIATSHGSDNHYSELMVDSTPSSGVACWDADITAKAECWFNQNWPSQLQAVVVIHFKFLIFCHGFGLHLFSSSNIIIVAAINCFVIACLCQTMGRILNVFMYYWVILTLCEFYVFFGRWNTREVEITVGWKRTLDWPLYFCHLFYTYLVCILFTYHPIHFVIVSDNGWNSESIHVQIVTLVDVIFYNLCFYRTLKTQQLSTKMTHSRPWNITGKEKKIASNAARFCQAVLAKNSKPG